MTDRHAAYIVTLTEDTREDDAEATINALRMVKGVVDVKPIVRTYTTHIAEARRDTVWTNTLLNLIDQVREAKY